MGEMSDGDWPVKIRKPAPPEDEPGDDAGRKPAPPPPPITDEWPVRKVKEPKQ